MGRTPYPVFILVEIVKRRKGEGGCTGLVFRGKYEGKVPVYFGLRWCTRLRESELVGVKGRLPYQKRGGGEAEGRVKLFL